MKDGLRFGGTASRVAPTVALLFVIAIPLAVFVLQFAQDAIVHAKKPVPLPQGMVPGLEHALQRRQCPVLKPGYPVSIALIHVPKTAGTLLVTALRHLLPQESPGRWCYYDNPPWPADFPNVFLPCEAGRPSADHQRLFEAVRTNFTHVCSGFAAHQDVAFFDALVDPARTVTMTALRHPVERAISTFYYGVSHHPDMFPEYVPQNDSDFDAMLRFLNLARFRNVAARQLGGAQHCEWPGLPPLTPPEELLETAKRRLESVCVLMITEFMEDSVVRLAHATGWPEAKVRRQMDELGVLNATPRPKAVPGHVRREIARLNELDMRLYEHGLRLFLNERR